MRTPAESNAINRVLRARGLPTLDEAGVIEALAFQVEDHQHFTELLRACDPRLRRDMYEAMRPHLRFPAQSLAYYEGRAAEQAECAQIPTIDEQGNLHDYLPTVIETPAAELHVNCSKCPKEIIFFASDKAEAIFTMRTAGWAYDESVEEKHICPECLDAC